ncbi:MAG: SAM-dependent methyltransferase, partial [Alphaproteobacteria bacterium]|nr:SAM-dependent methyltransferase [Alphaproteobacteria bacterium]
RQPDFIQRHIFPGGMLPTVPIIEALAAARGFTIDQLSFHGADYAETLRHWRARFEAAAVALDRLGYGERFRRLWRYYLAYCEAGFETERIDVVQIRLRRRGSVS